MKLKNSPFEFGQGVDCCVRPLQRNFGVSGNPLNALRAGVWHVNFSLIGLQYHPTLLGDVAQCRTRWPNKCNTFDATLETQGSGTKIYPESLETNLHHINWFAPKMARDLFSLFLVLRLCQMIATSSNIVGRCCTVPVVRGSQTNTTCLMQHLAQGSGAKLNLPRILRPSTSSSDHLLAIPGLTVSLTPLPFLFLLEERSLVFKLSSSRDSKLCSFSTL